MPDEPQNITGTIPTEGFPIAYANIASLTANFSDIRIYFADVQAKTVATTVSPTQQTVAQANISPRICVVLTPEFAKNLLDALSGTIALYEKQFGMLRSAPQPPTPAVPAAALKPANK